MDEIAQASFRQHFLFVGDDRGLGDARSGFSHNESTHACILIRAKVEFSRSALLFPVPAGPLKRHSRRRDFQAVRAAPKG